MSTAEQLVKDAAELFESNVLVPVIFQKCAEAGFKPRTEEEAQFILKVANDVREKIASGELAPVPAAELNAKGEMTKAASATIEQDPFAFGDDVEIDLNAVEDQVKEAAAVLAWAGLESMSEQK